jgi:hypothetical protein
MGGGSARVLPINFVIFAGVTRLAFGVSPRQMLIDGMSRWRSVMLNTCALVCGVIVAVVLASAYTWADATIDGGYPLLSPLEAMQVAAMLSGLVALEILVVCVPVWLLVERFGWANWAVAAALGFVAPPIWWILNNWIEGSGETALQLLPGTFPYAVCGATAGLSIFWTRPKHEKQTDASA